MYVGKTRPLGSVETKYLAEVIKYSGSVSDKTATPRVE